MNTTEVSRKELYSEKVTAGSRTYFFDVKESKEGKKYLVISESRAGQDHQRVMIFDEYLDAFTVGFKQALKFLRPKRLPKQVIQARGQYPRAYENWSAEEEQTVVKKYQSGNSIEELAAEFKRNPGAIRSRLRKLGMISN